MLDFRLMTFFDLCRTHSYTKTAQNLSMTQPAVSQHIKYLENYYHTRLVIYEKRHFSLTVEGQYLLGEITKLIVHSNAISKHILELSTDDKTPSLAVGTSPVIGEFIIPEFISSFRNAHPDYKIRSIIGTDHKLKNQLLSGGISLVISDMPEYYPEMEHCLFRSEPTICVCHPSHPLAGKEVALSRILQEPLAYRETDSRAYQILKEIFAAINFDLDSYELTYEAGSTFSIIEYLKQQNAVSFLYQFAVERNLKRGELAEIKVQEALTPIRFYCIYPATIDALPSARIFLDYCMNT